MIRKLLLATALLGAVPAHAFGPAAAPDEVRIPRMRGMLDWRPDGSHGLYIRADTGRWYYASLENDCPRLVTRSNVRFIAAPNGDFDRHGVVVADGWRCQVASISRSDGPPDYYSHHRR
ncbi:MAG: hypothetical protein JO276_10805 [Sphingomonadaceae bacterium]|nr:hypothetical protein [Sphingomonadaceae bacterium]